MQDSLQEKSPVPKADSSCNGIERSSSGVLQTFSSVANIPATHTVEITAAIPVTAIPRILLPVFNVRYPHKYYICKILG